MLVSLTGWVGLSFWPQIQKQTSYSFIKTDVAVYRSRFNSKHRQKPLTIQVALIITYQRPEMLSSCNYSIRISPRETSWKWKILTGLNHDLATLVRVSQPKVLQVYNSGYINFLIFTKLNPVLGETMNPVAQKLVWFWNGFLFFRPFAQINWPK